MAYQPSFYNPTYIMNPAVANQQQRFQQQVVDQQMYQPYQQPMMQQQVQPVSVGLNGRIIDDVSTVGPNEVSMDGSVSLFPKRDMSEIYAKQWQSDGTIKTVRFVPFIDETSNSTSNTEKAKNGANEVIIARLDELGEKIDGLKVNFNKAKAPKKESD